jgi:16S rRNA (cytosine1402-N4)-methyltransferase
MDEVPDKPSRRHRYSGRNPRSFVDKYKEHQPEAYPDDIAKILSSGKTPAGMHRPIMVREVLAALHLLPGDVVVDCTLGYGGHASELLAAVQPGGRLLGVDSDPIELPKTEARLRALGAPDDSIILRRMNFSGVSQFLAMESPDGVDGLLADLGVSSMQYDDPGRGFSFKVDGPLDMRMNPQRGLSATALLSTLDNEQLQTMLTDNSDEPNAVPIAKAILIAHSTVPLETTLALVHVVRNAMLGQTSSQSDLAIRRVFQAIRIAVNEEFRSLDVFLKQLPFYMKKGGRISILTFHSGEDRRVKDSFKQGFQNGLYSYITRDVVRPSQSEIQANSRASSAKLRTAIRS